LTVNHTIDKDTPQYDLQLFFSEIAVALDHEQYQDAILLGEMFHVLARQHQVR
jgi:vacuolar protein sorting-associated protein 13A/C